MRRNNNSNTTTASLNNNSNNSDSSNMEPSFYEDNAQQQSQFTTSSNTTTTTTSNNNNNNMKRPLSLDLNSKTPAKKQRLNQTVATTAVATVATPTALVLESPDLQGLKFNTPDLEKFILANTSLQTPTPSIVFPTKVR